MTSKISPALYNHDHGILGPLAGLDLQRLAKTTFMLADYGLRETKGRGMRDL